MPSKPHTLDITSARSFARILSGRYRSMVHGSGIEFSELREYAPGDDVRAIDWKTSARTGHVHTKRFQEERSMPIWFAFDTGASMRFGSRDRTKFQTVIEAFSLLAMACEENRDPYGIVAYNTAIAEVRPPVRGPINRAWWLDCLSRRSASADPALGELSALLSHFYRARLRHSLVFVFSDELDSIDLRMFRAIAHENDLILVTVLDSFERTADTGGMHHAVDSSRGDSFLSLGSGAGQAKFATIRTEKLAGISKLCRSVGARHLVLDDRSDIFREFDRFFQIPTHA